GPQDGLAEVLAFLFSVRPCLGRVPGHQPAATRPWRRWRWRSCPHAGPGYQHSASPAAPLAERCPRALMDRVPHLASFCRTVGVAVRVKVLVVGSATGIVQVGSRAEPACYGPGASE